MRYRIQPNFGIRHFQEHSSIYMFMSVLFLMGVIFGAVMVNGLSPHQKEDLLYYLHQFFGQVGEENFVQPKELVKLSFFDNIKIASLIWILGISIIGFPLIFLIIFLKGMVVGFSIGFLVNQMGWGGFLISFVSILPQNLFFIPIYIFLSVNAVALSMQLIKKIFIQQTFHIPLTSAFSKYIFTFVGSVLIILIAACIEAYISPVLMKSVINSIQ